MQQAAHLFMDSVVYISIMCDSYRIKCCNNSYVTKSKY